MSLQEIHKIPLTYQHWANKLDERDFKTAGLEGITERSIAAGVTDSDILRTLLPEEVQKDIGFIIEFAISTSGSHLTVNVVIDGMLFGTGNHTTYGGRYPINREFTRIDITNTSAGTLHYAFFIKYIPKSKYIPATQGQDSPVDSGPAPGIDIPPTVSPTDTEGMSG